MSVGDDLDRVLETAGRRQAAELKDLPPEAWAALAVLVDFGKEVDEDLFLAEVVRLVGLEGTDIALRALQKKNVLVMSVERWRYGRTRIGIKPALAKGLKPELAGLLARTGPEAPPDDGEVTDVADTSTQPILVAAAAETLGLRTTGDRLYKKDAERLAKTFGLADADAAQSLFLRVARLGFVDLSREVGVVWDAVAEWAALPPHERAARWIASLRAVIQWVAIARGAGAWMDEEDLARNWRLSFWQHGSDAARAAEAGWLEARGTIDSWPEVESRVHRGRRFVRLRPAFGALCRPRPTAAGRVHVQPNFEIIASPEVPASDLVTLARACDLRRADVAATFVLTMASVRRAARGGLGPEALLERLTAMATSRVPETVARAVRDWGGDVGRVTIERALLLRFDGEEVAARAARVLGARAQAISPTVLALDPAVEDEADVRKDLDEAGLGPRNEERTPRPRVPPQPEPAPLGLGLPPDRVEAVRKARRAGVLLELARIPKGRRMAPLDRRTQEVLPIEDDSEPASDLEERLWQAIELGADVELRLDTETIRLRPIEIRGSKLVGFVSGAAGPITVDPARIDDLEILVGTAKNVPRSAPCPCSSGQKFKHCCEGSDARM